MHVNANRASAMVLWIEINTEEAFREHLHHDIFLGRLAMLKETFDVFHSRASAMHLAKSDPTR